MITYQNPIISGFFPDPSICRVADSYYLVTSSFQYFPGIPIFRSVNLIDWELIGHCITRPSQVDLRGVPDSGGIWAPTIRYANGRFWVASTLVETVNFTNSLDEEMRHTGFDMHTRHFIVSAEDPAGEWSDPVWVDGDGFDPSLHLRDDGTAYFTFADHGTIRQGIVDVHTGDYVREPEAIWTGTAEVDTEGPHLYQIDDSWYLLVAEGGTSYDHSVAIGRSDSPWGPWEACPHNPVVTRRTDGGGPIQATGHADLFEDAAGDWWMVMLGTRPVGYPRFHTLGRETFLVPVTWVDGWPVVVPPQPTMDVDRSVVETASPRRSDVDEPASHVGIHSLCSLREPGRFMVAADARLELDDFAEGRAEAQSFLGVRQLEHDARLDVRVHLADGTDGASIGLGAYMDDAHFSWIGVHRSGEQNQVLVEHSMRGIRTREVLGEAPQGFVTLRIESTAFAYTFTWRDSGTDTVIASRSAQAMSLSSEVAGGFTGVFLALIARGAQRSTALSFEPRFTPLAHGRHRKLIQPTASREEALRAEY